MKTYIQSVCSIKWVQARGTAQFSMHEAPGLLLNTT